MENIASISFVLTDLGLKFVIFCCFANFFALFLKVQSNSIIVDSIIVENSKIVDDLAATKDFYLIKIHNSRNSKIVELFLERLREILPFPNYFCLYFQPECLAFIFKCPPLHVLFSQNDNLMLFSIFDIC